jgi:hypothetical protein
MENTRIKFIASQAKSIYHYKTIRSKILRCNADISFNKQCLRKNIVPKYANINVPITSNAAHSTQARVSSIRIKDEIKFLYRKKDPLNKKLYQTIGTKTHRPWRPPNSKKTVPRQYHHFRCNFKSDFNFNFILSYFTHYILTNINDHECNSIGSHCI